MPSRLSILIVAAVICVGQSLAVEPPAPSNPPEAEKSTEVAEIERLDQDGFSQILRAAMTGKIDEVKKLLDGGAKVDAFNSQRETPLDLASDLK